MLKVVKFSLAVLLILTTSAILFWQYLEYRKETDFFKFQIRKYEEFYQKDRYGLEGKTMEEIQGLINHAENQLNKYSSLLPDSTYMNLYKFIDGIEQLFVSSNVVFALNNIESIKKDFYEELYYSVSLSGQLKDIKECIGKIIDKNKLISLTHVCLSNSKNDDLSGINLNFKTYMFNGGTEKPVKNKTKKKTPISEREIKTWLPPLSMWATAYKNRAIELNRLEQKKKNLKQKIDMFDTYKTKLNKLNHLKVIIEHLGHSTRPPRVSMNDIYRCTDR